MDLSISIESSDILPQKVMETGAQNDLLKALYAAHNGVYRMSPAIADLVETSNNIAKVTVQNGSIKIECLTRSSVKSSIDDLVNTLTSVFELANFDVTATGEYPGWAPNMDSDILKVLDRLYEKLNGKKAHVAACHAGREC